MALHKPEHRTWQYWAAWPFLTIAFCLIWPIARIVKGYAWTRKSWLRDLENYVDDPIDFIKEFFHCRRIPGTSYQINISFLMLNRATSWDVIRKNKDWPNCHAE